MKERERARFALRLCLFLLALAAVLPRTTLAQEVAPPDALVYVLDDDPEIQRLFEEAEDLVESRKWQDAIDRYLTVLDRHENQLVVWGPRTHISAAEAARMALIDLPPEGQQALLQRFEQPLSERLEAATSTLDAAALAEIADGAPVPAATRAALRYADIAMESGDWNRALRVLHRVHFLHRGRPAGIDVGALHARMLYCRNRLGDRPFIDPLGDDLARPGDSTAAIGPDGAATTRIGGTDTTLNEFVAGLAAGVKPTAEWSTFGGNPAHSRDAGFDRLDYGLAWSFGELPDDADGADDDTRTLRSPEQEPNPVQPLFPVEHDGSIYLYDKHHATALDRESGTVRWRVALDRFGKAPSKNDRTYFYGTAGSGRFVLLHEALDETGLDGFYYEGAPRHRKLVVLSAESGDTVWVRGGPEDDAPELTGITLTGAPIVLDGRVLIAGKKIEEEEGEAKSFAFAFSLADGALLWSTFLCSSPALNSHRHVFSDGPFLAYGEGHLYCGTDIGTLSALDPDNGEHLWCFRYERVPYRTRDNSRLIYSFFESWSDNPMIVTGGRIYATPGDSQYLHILLFYPDRDTGLVQLDRIAKARYRYLIGVRDRVVYLAGRDEADRYHIVSAYHPEGGERAIVWEFPIPNPRPDRVDAPIDYPKGRAAVSGNRLFVPTYKGVYVLDASTGSLIKQIPNPAGDTRFGNLQSAGNDMITAYLHQVNCFRYSN